MEIQINLINERAWSFHNTTGIDFDELQAQATLAYLEAISAFDNNKRVKLTTFAYEVITNNLISFCKMYKQSDLKIDYNDNIFGKAYTKIKVNINQSIRNFPKGVRDLIKIILARCDQDQFDFTNTREIISHIHYVLEFYHGWGQRRRKQAVKDLKKILKETPEGELF